MLGSARWNTDKLKLHIKQFKVRELSFYSELYVLDGGGSNSCAAKMQTAPWKHFRYEFVRNLFLISL
jgi:hypothetical protein